MKVYLCCIARRENLYIRDFVSYYKNIGFDKIILCDNNYDGEDNFGDVIQDYIDDGFVIVENYRNAINPQWRAYFNSYDKYKSECEWMAFFDIDEFLTLPKHNTVKEYLSQEKFKNMGAIHVNWKTYGDNGEISYREAPVWERFPNESEMAKTENNLSYTPSIINDHIKSIIHTSSKIFQNYMFCGPHILGIVGGMVCNEHGDVISNDYLNSNYDYSEAYLKHYSTKTAGEYVRKLEIAGGDNFPDPKAYIERFFKINERTVEKEEILYGIDRIGIINHLIQWNNYKSYLEIGIFNGENFKSVTCEEKECCDPEPSGKYASDICTYKMTSDEMFSIMPKSKKYDIIFIDGLHLADYVMRDILNSLKHLNANGKIVVHDVLPQTKSAADKIFNGGIWNGTVYQAMVALKNNGIKFYSVETDYHAYGGICGCSVIDYVQNAESIEYIEPSNISFEEYYPQRNSLMNVVPSAVFITNKGNL